MSEFSKLGLSQPLVQSISELGFEKPTPIQEQAIPRLLLNDTDLVGLAQTGTGKTAAFGLPMLDIVEPSFDYIQALVLAPTRELCLQISKDLKSYASHMKKLKIVAVYGGTDIGRQIRDIRRGAHIIAATPGRLRDMINRKVINLDKTEIVVLDEADEMLNMGFKEEIDEILLNTPEEKNTWLFSATMPKDVRRIAKNYMENPLEISIGDKNTSNQDITHQYIFIRPNQRYEALLRFLDYDADIFGLVFTRTRRDSSMLAEQLSKDGYNADALHGDLNQGQRDRVMDKFRRKRLQVLVATDVAARGIDVQDITHVFHYNIPDDISFYTHRAGRTGRAGKKGISLVLAHPNDMGLIRLLERRVRIRFEKAHIPNGEEIVKQRLVTRLRKFKATEIGEDVEELTPILMEELEDLSREELIKIMAAVTFKRLLKTYKNAADLNKATQRRTRISSNSYDRRDRGRGRDRDRDRGDRSSRRSSAGGKMRRLFINIGGIDIDRKGDLIEIIAKHSKVPSSAIGKVNMDRRHSFFDVDESYVHQIIEEFKDTKMEGRAIRVNQEGQGKSKSGNGHKKDFKKWKKRR